MIGVPTHSPVKRLGLDCPPTSRKPLSQAPDLTHTAPHSLPPCQHPASSGWQILPGTRGGGETGYCPSGINAGPVGPAHGNAVLCSRKPREPSECLHHPEALGLADGGKRHALDQRCCTDAKHTPIIPVSLFFSQNFPALNGP